MVIKVIAFKAATFALQCSNKDKALKKLREC